MRREDLPMKTDLSPDLRAYLLHLTEMVEEYSGTCSARVGVGLRGHVLNVLQEK